MTVVIQYFNDVSDPAEIARRFKAEMDKLLRDRRRPDEGPAPYDY